MKFLALIFTASVLLLSTTSTSAAATLSATLSASPASFSGGCPKTITFNGTITARNWSPTALRRVDFKFIRDDGANAPVQSLTFPAGGGTQNVSTTWMLGASHRGWEAIEILYPQSATSAHANFTLVCSGSVPVVKSPIFRTSGPPTVRESPGPAHIERRPFPQFTPRPRRDNGRAPIASEKRQLTPQQRALLARKLAAMKQRMAIMQSQVKAAVLAKKAHWERQQIARRIQLWQAIAPRLNPQAHAAVRSVIAGLSSVDAKIGSLNRPIEMPTSRFNSPSYRASSPSYSPGSKPISEAPLPPNGGNGGCATPQITSLSVSQGQPGDPIVISGSGFGSTSSSGFAPGQVSFIINPGKTVQATSIDYWSNTQIVTSVPTVSGIASPYAGVVYVATCAQSNVVSFQFNPEIVVQQLPITMADVSWSDPNCPNNAPQPTVLVSEDCSSTQIGLVQTAWGGVVSGTKGDDQFFTGYQLANGWVLDSALLEQSSGPNNGNEIKTANIGTSSPLVDVHWWVEAAGFGISVEGYILTIYIHGPNGVPYQ